jgi:hypothetical protein
MWLRVALMGTLAAALLCGQDSPQLIWQGEVADGCVLHIRGNRVDAAAECLAPGSRPRFHFYARLPERRQQVRLEVVEGRGSVRVLEQPRLDNQYTLTVRIEDRQPGSSLYSLAFHWEPDRIFTKPRGRREKLTWRGRVEGETIVSCRGRTCEARLPDGGPIAGGEARFTKPLPSREVAVNLEQSDGRGQIRLVGQPRESNGYAAQVLISDPQRGSSEYRFTLVWTQPRRGDADFGLLRRGMVWSGRVDGSVRVAVEGHAAMSQALSGQPPQAERVEFLRGLPPLDNPNCTLERLQGRGSAKIVEYPSARNHFRLVFEIDDPPPGADTYEIELRW